jgi:hypothetical protein
MQKWGHTNKPPSVRQLDWWWAAFVQEWGVGGGAFQPGKIVHDWKVSPRPHQSGQAEIASRDERVDDAAAKRSSALSSIL